MRYRRLGTSGLKVSEIGLGCNNFGVRMDQGRSAAVVEAALAAGITFFDTADFYGDKMSEILLGKALGSRRHDIVLATKFGLPMAPGPYWAGGSRRYIIRAVDACLTRLSTDYIDLLQMHFPDPETPIEETLRALDDLITAGKVRYIGSSNFAGWQVADADWTARTEHFARFISAQNQYNLLERNIAREVLQACEHLGLGFLPFFPLASGRLTGKCRRGTPPPEGTRLAILGQTTSDRDFDRLEALEAWAGARGHTILELAFAWLLGHPAISSVIAGASSPEQVAVNTATADWRLTSEEVAEVAALA